MVREIGVQREWRFEAWLEEENYEKKLEVKEEEGRERREEGVGGI